MFAFVIFTFGICWLPYHVYFIYSYHNPQVGQKLQYRFQKCVFNTGIILNLVSASPPLHFLLFPDYEVASHQKHLSCFLLARNGNHFSSDYYLKLKLTQQKQAFTRDEKTNTNISVQHATHNRLSSHHVDTIKVY